MALALDRKHLCLAKVETTSGTDASPTAGSNAMLIYGDGASLLSYDHKRVSKTPLTASLTNRRDMIGRTVVPMQVETVLQSNEVAGSGRPWYYPFLLASALSEASGGASGSSSTVYTPRSSGFQSLTMYVYGDGALAKAFGCQSSMKLVMKPGEVPELMFTLKGTYNKPAAASFPAATYPTVTQRIVQSANLALGGYTAANGLKWANLELDLGINLQEITDGNSPEGFAGFQVTSKDPVLRLLVYAENTIDASGFASSAPNFLDYLKNPPLESTSDTYDISWVHGSAVQSQIDFLMRKPQLVDVKPVNQNGFAMRQLEYKIQNSSDDQEFRIAFKEKL